MSSYHAQILLGVWNDWFSSEREHYAEITLLQVNSYIALQVNSYNEHQCYLLLQIKISNLEYSLHYYS